MAGEGDRPEWVSALPEDIRGWQEVETSGDDPEKFWQQISDMRSRMGQSIRIPSQEASDEAKQAFYEKLAKVEGVTRIPPADDTEAWASFYNRIGRPGKPEEYGFDADAETKKFLHGLGLSEAQAARLVESQNEKKQKDQGELAKLVQEQTAALDAEWGEAKPRKIAGIKAVLDKYDEGGKLREVLMNNPDFPHAAELMRVFGRLGDEYTERNPPDTTGGSWGITPAEARARADDILNNPDSPRNNPNHPGHRQAQDEYMRLRRIATGEGR